MRGCNWAVVVIKSCIGPYKEYIMRNNGQVTVRLTNGCYSQSMGVTEFFRLTVLSLT